VPPTRTDPDVTAVEHWFTSRGTPHLIEDYSAAEDVLTRALPAFTLLFLLELTVALSKEWTWWQNALAAAGAFALLLAIWAGVNRLRGLPLLARPARVGTAELAAFVLGPAVVAAIFGQPRQALGVAAVNLGLVALVYVVTSYGLLPLIRWATARVFRELGEVGGLLSRALPLLLLFVTFLFLTTEVWEVAGPMEWQLLLSNIVLFFLLGVTFLLARLPTETARLADFDELDAVVELCNGTPGAALAPRLSGLPEPAPLRRRQRGNLYLVILVSQTIQITLVSLVVGAFFVAFGLLSIRPEVIAGWTGPAEAAAVEPIFEFGFLGREAVLTPALLRVAIFLAAFSGFYVAIYAVTDTTYREQFFDRIASELRQTLAVRAAYLEALRHPDAG
jgi:hypothetical protein